MKSGAFDDAEKILKAVTADSPQDASAWHVLGSTYFRQNKLELAEACYRQRLVLTPEKAIANYSLALVLSGLNRQEEAKFYVSHALRIDPNYGPAKELEQQLITFSKAKTEQHGSTILPVAQAPTPQSQPPQVAAAAVVSGALGFYAALRGDTSPISKDAVALIDQLRMTKRSDSPIGLIVLAVSLLVILYHGVVFVFAVLTSKKLDQLPFPNTAVPLLLSIAAAVIAITYILLKRTTRYELREGLLKITRGILRKKTVTYELFRLASVDVYRGPVRRLFNSGTLTLTIEGRGGAAEEVRLVGLARGRDLLRLQDELRNLAQLLRQNPLIMGISAPSQAQDKGISAPSRAQDKLRKLDHPQATPGARSVGPATDRARSPKETSLLLPDTDEEFLDYERRTRRKERIDFRAKYVARIMGLPWWGVVLAASLFIFTAFLALDTLDTFYNQKQQVTNEMEGARTQMCQMADKQGVRLPFC
jgi:membrane protein YdbS with pleckstrin-like domain